jgi:hypothetical protein
VGWPGVTGAGVPGLGVTVGAGEDLCPARTAMTTHIATTATKPPPRNSFIWGVHLRRPVSMLEYVVPFPEIPSGAIGTKLSYFKRFVQKNLLFEYATLYLDSVLGLLVLVLVSCRWFVCSRTTGTGRRASGSFGVGPYLRLRSPRLPFKPTSHAGRKVRNPPYPAFYPGRAKFKKFFLLEVRACYEEPNCGSIRANSPGAAPAGSRRWATRAACPEGDAGCPLASVRHSKRPILLLVASSLELSQPGALSRGPAVPLVT